MPWVPLDDDSSFLTTFITPFGKYIFTRVPMGISLGPEVFQTKMEETFGSLEGCEPLSHDTIVYGKTKEENDRRLQKVLDKIEQSGLRLNRDKCHLKKTEVKYFGHIITKDGIRPNNERVEAILKLKEPENDCVRLENSFRHVQLLGKVYTQHGYYPASFASIT